MLRHGQQVRELIIDLCKPFDYNKEFQDKTGFLKTEVPNVLNYIHEVNFQKFYKTTISIAQMSMAFNGDGSLFTFIEEATAMLYESYVYDTFVVDKYMLCRRILNGTVPAVKIDNYETITNRERVSALKAVSNKFTFRSPNFNPAGIRRATSFDDQILIVNTDFEADFTTDVLATSFFKGEADMRSRLALIDSFSSHDTGRLTELLLEAYKPFTTEEITRLSKIPGVLIAREWFMDYDYALTNDSNTIQKEFENPQTLERNIYLHAWSVFSTSPFENCVVFTPDDIAVTSVTVSPATASVTAGQSIKLSAVVETTGFANQAVIWSTNNANVKINSDGTLIIPVGTTAGDIIVTATSVYDSTKTGTATITVVA